MIKEAEFCEIYYCKLKTLDHPKYCICIDPIQRFFIFINSNPSINNPNGDVPIKPIRELNFLDHVSYINTSHILRIYDIDIEWSKLKSKLSESLIEILCKIIFCNSLITNKNKKTIWNQLNNQLKEKLIEYQPKNFHIPKIT